jgi:hypothetical protein
MLPLLRGETFQGRRVRAREEIPWIVPWVSCRGLAGSSCYPIDACLLYRLGDRWMSRGAWRATL